ncbi:uncharacterized protein BCR38DRAFT_522670 [Pseudomassariella vexata]|uniref:Uncharacterized protein n=1 Tax=Pseudomassariella vexata TaxID=1141098 RepID=A0A1Y2E927_9PEZI|nr:uncharacterized protein BCR38DRAFT_522670 [Pseudomassariella vexata]ORY67814.1 hypothetical protein BCR38DRAFT_522670 [Pseudomassariella vexata]
MSPSPHQNEPIAIIGSGCRFPGGSNSGSKLWELLKNPRDVSQPIGGAGRFNEERFYHPEDGHNGTTNTQRAYLLSENFRHFDAKFFAIPPGEAEAIDPQQRLLLEVVYEAVEEAGLTINGLSGSDTACYVGIMCQDFFTVQSQDVLSVPKYAVTGIAASNASSRVSYFFDWHGPSMTIDTACSSSMVCVNEAVQALRNGTSRVAVACGTNLLLSPFMYIALSKVGMVSPTGRSHMWDEAADGYARGEGVSCVVLKTLSAAIQDGDDIACVIREIGLNHDGKTKGLTMPSAEAQAALIRETYKRAGLDPSTKSGRCQFFEAHGTGTPTGDPREAEALDVAFFPDHDAAEGELLVGSIKTVIGHTEGCAGIAGILKACLSLRHATILPNFLFNRLNPAVEPFTKYLRIPTACEPWPEVPQGQPRRASINSFGFGGANAHCIIESYQPRARAVNGTNGDHDNGTILNGSGHSLTNGDSATNGDAGYNRALAPTQVLIPFVFSATSVKSLVGVMENLREFLERNPEVHLPSLAYALCTRRSALSLRGAIYATSAEQLGQRIQEKLGTAVSDPGATSHSVAALSAPPSILGIFTGQGAQWSSMGSKLFTANPKARKALDNLDASLARLPMSHRPSWTLAEVLSADSEYDLGEAAISQPVCTAVQIVLVDLLRAAGVKFRAVVGHSSGEIAAAYAAGFLSAWDAIRIAYYRGYFAKFAAGPEGQKGGMVAVGTDFDDAYELCQTDDLAGRLCVAAHNSPTSVTLSGDVDAVNLAMNVFEEEEKFARVLKVDTAYHSAHMQQCSASYLKALNGLGIQPLQPDDEAPQWFSSVDNSKVVASIGKGLDGPYWVDNMVKPVQFYPAIKTCVGSIAGSQAINFAVEIGPHPALRGPAKESMVAITGQDMHYSGTLRRGSDDVEAFSDALGEVWARFGPAHITLGDFQKTCRPDIKVEAVRDLPAYPWTHEVEYWAESKRGKVFTTQPGSFHDLLGLREPDGLADELRWRHSLNLNDLKWLAGHTLQGQVVFPATGYICMLAEAALQMAQDQPVAWIDILDLEIRKAIAVHEHHGTEIMVSLAKVVPAIPDGTTDTMTASFSIFSAASRDSTQMALNCCGNIRISLGTDYMSRFPARRPLVPSMVSVEVDRFYQVMREEVGLGSDGPFRGLTSILRRAGHSTVTARNAAFSNAEKPLLFHPAMLDCALQGLNVAFATPGDGSLWDIVAPTYFGRVTLIPELLRQNMNQEEVAVDSTNTDARGMTPTGDVEVYTSDFVHKLIEMEDVKISPLAWPTAEHDRFLFQESIMCPDKLDAILSRGNMRLTPEEKAKGYHAERVAFYYLRTLFQTTTPELCAKLPRYRQCLLAEAERLYHKVKNGEHPFAAASWVDDTRESIFALLDTYADDDIDLGLTKTVGENLLREEVLTGEINILQYMTRNSMLERVYSESVGYPILNSVGTGLMAQLCKKYPRMNILEVGAGTGGTTAGILANIGEAYASYTYTDISSAFFERAGERFRAHRHKMIFNMLDITKDPTAQGFKPQGYDVVIAQNVLHATAPLRDSLAHARRLLKPGGVLIIMELVRSEAMRFGFVVGSLPGWWVGEDDGRKGGPLLTPAEWETMLEDNGFAVETVSEALDPEDIWAVIAARVVDSQVAPLMKPLSNDALPIERRGRLLVLGGKQATALSIREHVTAVLEPYFTGDVIYLDDLANLDPETEMPDGLHVLILTECDEYLWKDMNDTVFENLKRVLIKAVSVLWLVRGSQDTNPYAAVTLGFLRTIFYELPDTRLQTLDIGTEISKVNPEMVAQCMLRLGHMADMEVRHELARVLWSVEPELFLKEDGRLYVPRLRCSEDLNARYNSSKRFISRKVEVSQSMKPLDLVWDDRARLGVVDFRGSYVLREQNEFGTRHNSSDDEGSTFVRIRVSCSFLSSLKTPAGFFFLCLGTDMKTGAKTLCFSDHQASILNVPRSWAVHLEGGSALEDVVFMSFAVVDLLARRVLQFLPPAGSVVIFDANPVASALISKRLTDLGSKVFVVTSQQPQNNDSVPPEPALYLHPHSPKRVIDASLPSDVTLYIDGSDQSTSSISRKLGSRIAASLSPVCEKVKLSSMMGREASSLSPTAPETLATLLPSVAEFATMFSQLGPIPIAGGAPIDVLPLSQVLSSTTPGPKPDSLVYWQMDQHVPLAVEPVYMRKDLFRPDRTYWLAGLSGTLGRSLADFLAAHDARHIVISSRTPKVDQEWVDWHSKRGVTVAYFSGDVIDYESVKQTYSEIRKCMPLIGGVAIGAMVLIDSTFMTQRFEDFQAILQPKMKGTINLDRLFSEQIGNSEEPLDWFIGFSSLVAYTGNPGQAAYGAGNCFLKSLIRDRHNRGLAGSTIDIGRMAGVGYIERALTWEFQARLKLRSGTLSMSESDLHQLFAEAVVAGRPGSGLDPELIAGIGLMRGEEAQAAFWNNNARMSMMIREVGNAAASGNDSGVGGGVPLRKLLEGSKTIKDVGNVIIGALRTRLQMLKFLPDSDSLHDTTPLVDLGLDSLIAVDMRSWFQKELAVDVPVMKILGGASIVDLVDSILEKLPQDILSQLDGTPNNKVPILVSGGNLAKEDMAANEEIPDVPNSKDLLGGQAMSQVNDPNRDVNGEQDI